MKKHRITAQLDTYRVYSTSQKWKKRAKKADKMLKNIPFPVNSSMK